MQVVLDYSNYYVVLPWDFVTCSGPLHTVLLIAILSGKEKKPKTFVFWCTFILAVLVYFAPIIIIS